MVLPVLSHFAMKYELNIIILLFDIFQIIYNIDMKYLIYNVYHDPRRPSSTPQSPDLAITHSKLLDLGAFWLQPQTFY